MSILAIALVHLVAVISPGANFLVVSRNALSYSRRSGLLTARGVALGSLIYITVGMLGLATIIAHSPIVFNLIKLVGTAYFLYTGIRALASLRSRPARSATVENLELPPERRAFLGGLVTALSNPTSALYFLALFTTFVQVSTSTAEKGLLALVLVTISLSWYTVVALTFSHRQVRLVYSRFEHVLNGFIGILWIALAAKLLLAS